MPAVVVPGGSSACIGMASITLFRWQECTQAIHSHAVTKAWIAGLTAVCSPAITGIWHALADPCACHRLPHHDVGARVLVGYTGRIHERRMRSWPRAEVHGLGTASNW